MSLLVRFIVVLWHLLMASRKNVSSFVLILASSWKNESEASVVEIIVFGRVSQWSVHIVKFWVLEFLSDLICIVLFYSLELFGSIYLG